MNSQAFYRTRERQGTVSGENRIIESDLLPCYAAVCTFQLIKPKDWGGEFHKLNPENIEEGGGGENSDSQRMFSSERCFLLLQ